jgi:carboxypeptidase C (cathepsin A)
LAVISAIVDERTRCRPRDLTRGGMGADHPGMLRGSLPLAALRAALLGAALALPYGIAAADDPPPKSVELVEPADAITAHKITIGGKELAYTATAGSLPMRDGKGESQGTVYYVAYTLDGATKAERPISFVFNGGPGAASAYLHIGALGPRVLAFGEDGAPSSAASQLADNQESWLPFTDLVFVDPVGTGFSRAKNEEAAKQFWGVKQDIEALARFVRLYLARTDRLSAPKYLVGESYGGFRAAALPHRLATEEGVQLAGTILVSPVIEFGLMIGSEFSPLADALRLPAYAAVAMEREGRPVDRARLADVERFALSDYLAGLVAGGSDAERATRLYAEVAKLTGLSEDIVARRRGRIPIEVFQKEFRRGEGRIISRYDGSASGADPYPGSTRTRGGDPVLEGSKAAFTSTMLEYYRQELGLKTELPYRLLNGEVNGKWDWRSGLGWSQGYVGASDELREALALNPKLKVMIAHGITDLQTPYMMSRYVIDHLPPLGPGLRVALKLYPGGHMMYMRAGSRALLRDDAASFYVGTTE